MSRIMGFIHDRLADRGHYVDYFTADDVPIAWQGNAGRRFGFQVLVRRAAIEAARRGRPYDIVNVHEPHGLAVTISRSSAGSPSVFLTSHGLERRAWALAREEARLGRRRVALKTRLTYPATSLWPASVALRLADHVFCLNSEDREHLLWHYGRRSETITRIFPGADLMYVRASRDYSRAARILFAASWRDNKGIADLIPAFVTVAERHPNVRLAIVGAGVSEDVLRRSFPGALQSRIDVETPSCEREMAAAFSASDVFLLPSLFEGTPLTLIQAMMSGLPVVTTATCGMKDVIADDRTGILVPVRSPAAIVGAVEKLIAAPALRERLGHAAQTVAIQNYTWEHAAQPVEDAYIRLRAVAAA